MSVILSQPQCANKILLTENHVCIESQTVCIVKATIFALYLMTKNFNTFWPSDVILRHRSGSTLAQVMACCLSGTKPLPEPMLTYHKSAFVQASGTIQFNEFKNDTFDITVTSLKGQWVNIFIPISVGHVPGAFTENKSSGLVQVMAGCHWSASHYLNQSWPKYIAPYDPTRPQWVMMYMTWIRNHIIFYGMQLLIHALTCTCTVNSLI